MADQPTILVVDDNRLVRELVEETFVEAGFAVVTAANGREALERVREARPDLVVTDAVMPELDGWGFCEALKSDPATHDVPVVFLASQREVPDRLRGLRLGAHDYVCKPFSTEELLLRVKLILERTGPPDRSVPAPRNVLSGHASHMPAPDLVQLLAMNGKTGCLRLNGRASGRIWFKDGRIVGAATERARAKKALYRMLAWSDAAFEFDPGEEPGVGDEFGGSTQRLLMDALVAIDDLARLGSSLPPDGVPLGLAEGATALFAIAHELTMVDREVLRAAAERRTLRETLDGLDGTDLEIARAVVKLIDRGAIAPVNP